MNQTQDTLFLPALCPHRDLVRHFEAQTETTLAHTQMLDTSSDFLHLDPLEHLGGYIPQHLVTDTNVLTVLLLQREHLHAEIVKVVRRNLCQNLGA